MTDTIIHTFVISDDTIGKRLDQAVSNMLPDYSRSQIKTWIDSGELTVNNKQVKPRYKIAGGEKINISATPQILENWSAQDIPLTIIYEDDDILVINKPIGLVVHPGAGTPDGTLANALLFYNADLEQLPRAGIVHRLDRDTSGLLVIAKTMAARQSLIKQLETRTMSRIYFAIVIGHMTAGFTINKNIGRHPKQRTKMAVLAEGFGKEAITHVRVLEKYPTHTFIRVQLETGRTHQIRVHLADKRYPIVGDMTYGLRLKLPKNASEALVTALREFKHQALFAAELSLIHPVTGETMTWQAEAPKDMAQLIELLRNNTDCNT